jgi:hypothetical protein
MDIHQDPEENAQNQPPQEGKKPYLRPHLQKFDQITQVLGYEPTIANDQ